MEFQNTKIKLCGIRRPEEIGWVNELQPEYIGFVFAEKSFRMITEETARQLKEKLHPKILAVGVFVDEDPERVCRLLKERVIDIAQLHGSETEADIRTLQQKTGQPVIKAFRIREEKDLQPALQSSADYILLDSGAGSGRTFDWTLLSGIEKPYFLAGGLDPGNVFEALSRLHPYAVDVSSGIETGQRKDREKMRAFTERVRLR